MRSSSSGSRMAPVPLVLCPQPAASAALAPVALIAAGQTASGSSSGEHDMIYISGRVAIAAATVVARWASASAAVPLHAKYDVLCRCYMLVECGPQYAV
jgi:hypothetical protein